MRGKSRAKRRFTAARQYLQIFEVSHGQGGLKWKMRTQSSFVELKFFRFVAIQQQEMNVCKDYTGDNCGRSKIDGGIDLTAGGDELGVT